MPSQFPPSLNDWEQSILWRVAHSLGSTADRLSAAEAFRAVALACRDQMMERWLETERRRHDSDSKRVYYLSMEFLIGRSLSNNLANLRLWKICCDALARLGFDLSQVEDAEVDAALGNGGLGRLAVCFLDSMATLGIAGHGYGINYEYGLFRQEIHNGQQVEAPDNWRTCASPWQLERPEDIVIVPLYGNVEHARDSRGGYNPMWLDWKVVLGVPYDMPIVGYGGQTVNYLRLYTARAPREIDMRIFNEGDYINAVQQRVTSETISKVLYPSDSVAVGRELRLIQEYFLVACAMRDIVQRHRQRYGDLTDFASKTAIQLNDTHPALAIAELMRILLDESDFTWEAAWETTANVFAYTNHTLLPEALEKWPVSLLERVLPRHMQIIYEINHRFLQSVARRWPGDEDRQRRMSLIEEGADKQVRMAHLAIAGSHSVNGVAQVHSSLIRTSLVPDFYDLWPEKFNNKTNGVTQRRWLLCANPGLAHLICEAIGDAWIKDFSRIRDLEPFAQDAEFRQRLLAVKRKNKEKLARHLRSTMGLAVDCNAVFDVHIKRIHEYKRQLLNLLRIIHQYLMMTEHNAVVASSYLYVFAGKAAPGYHAAKEIIRAINEVASLINGDPRTRGRLQVVFAPDYRVSLAELIIPAADISQQISTAGMEASGTSNMKFAMNGALTMGTWDGANIEMQEEIGEENMFMFGLTVDQIQQIRQTQGYHPSQLYQGDPSLQMILESLRDSRFCPQRVGGHKWVFDRLLTQGEPYFHLADLPEYLFAHRRAQRHYVDPMAWAQKAALNIARSAKFSSDRAIDEYARDIWKTSPC